MKTPNCFAGLMMLSMIVLCAGSAAAWDTRWQFKQDATSNTLGSGSRDIEMQKKFDYNSMNTFKGTIDNSNGYTVMRNLNGYHDLSIKTLGLQIKTGGFSPHRYAR
jgi:hypothetical protein